MNFIEKHKNLNKKQRQAVDSIEGPVMVVAGPGTGKTTILTLRIANILLKTDTKPENILALTFTNSGVNAIRKKLTEYIGDQSYRVNIFTFHSFAENIIKEFSFYFKKLEFSRVISDLEKIEILEEIIGSFEFDDDLSQIKNAIDSIKHEGLNPKEFEDKIPKWEKELFNDENIFYKKDFGKYKKGEIKPAEKEKIEKKIEKAKRVAKIFYKYQEEIEKRNLYDFSDMILNVLKELEHNENLKLDLQEQYQYLLIDEHQDTNDGQNKLIELLTDAEHLNGKPNLFTVGDEKQSIYRFQGASEETFKHFNQIYKDVEVINLEENYRSSQNILDGAYSLISHTIKNSTKLKSLISDIDEKKKINFLEFSNYKFELLYLALEIKKQIDSGINPEEIAIIYRSNKQVEDLKNVFNQYKIPFTILSKEYLLEDKNINNLITLLRVIDNPKDNHCLAKALFINFLNFDSYEVTDLLSSFRSGYLFEKITNPKFEKNKLFINFTNKIKELKTKSQNVDFVSFFKIFIEEIGYLEKMLSDTDSQYQLIKLDKFFDEIKRQVEKNKNYGLKDFIKFIDSYQKYNIDIETNDPEIIEGVKLMTAHKSKGLEFENVYIINSTRKNWEKSRGFGKIDLPIKDYRGDIDDERRLFYVAMTRAKNNLTITSSTTDWEGKEKDKSQFITEIDQNFIENIDTKDFEKNNLDNLHLFIRKVNIKKSIFDKEYLAKKFLEKKLNVTSLNNYLNCPMKYLFRSLIKIPSEYSASLLYGDLIHNSLEKFFNESLRKEKIQKKELLLKTFQLHIENSIFNEKEYKKYLKKGLNALEEYHNQYFKNWILNIENEKYIEREFKLDNGEKININGRLDKIEFLDSKLEGKINIVDYKTGKAFSEKSSRDQKEDLKRQLIFYHLLYEDYADNKFFINKAVLDFIEKNKKGDFEQFTFDVSDEDKKDLKKEINKMTEEILSGEFLNLGCEKRDCEYCKLKENLK